jgi:hypothetical protein
VGVLTRRLAEPWRLAAGTGGRLARASQVIRGVFNDVAVKVPRYVHAWRDGPLRPAELTRRAKLARSRGRLDAMAREAEARLCRAD